MAPVSVPLGQLVRIRIGVVEARTVPWIVLELSGPDGTLLEVESQVNGWGAFVSELARRFGFEDGAVYEFVTTARPGAEPVTLWQLRP